MYKKMCLIIVLLGFSISNLFSQEITESYEIVYKNSTPTHVEFSNNGKYIVAGIYGALSASRKIFFVQALPAILALAFVLLR